MATLASQCINVIGDVGYRFEPWKDRNYLRGWGIRPAGTDSRASMIDVLEKVIGVHVEYRTFPEITFGSCQTLTCLRCPPR